MSTPAFPAILVPLDGSALAERALPVAATLAHRTGATLHLASVQVPIPALRASPEEPTVDTKLEQELREQIVEFAYAVGPDLVAVGTHGARGVERMLLGSVADKVIRGAAQPVLVVPVRIEHRQAAETTPPER